MTIPNLLEILFIAILLCACFAVLFNRRDMSQTFWHLFGGSIAGAALLFGCFWHTGCTTTQRQAVQSALSSSQAKSIEAAGEVIAQAALAVYAPEFSWTLPLAINAASGLISSQNTAQAVQTVESTVNSVAAIPAYAPIATQIGNAIAAIAPANEAQRVAATQALAQAIAANLPK